MTDEREDCERRHNAVAACDLYAFMNDHSAVHRIVRDVTARSGGAAAIVVRASKANAFIRRDRKRMAGGDVSNF